MARLAHAVLCAMWVAGVGCEVHHVVAGEGEEVHHLSVQGWRDLVADEEYDDVAGHFMVRFEEGAPGMDAVSSSLDGAPVHLVPGAADKTIGYCVYTKASKLLNSRYKPKWMRKMQPHHKRHSTNGIRKSRSLIVSDSSSDEDGGRGYLERVLVSRGIKVKQVLTTTKAGNQHRVVLEEESQFADAAEVASHIESVRWVEAHREAMQLNDVATKTVQGESFSQLSLWKRGLTGKGEIVLIGDTGLDYDHCFFRDPDQDVVLYPKVNLKHRKVVSYFEYVDGAKRDHQDRVGAHGTHVAGSLAGKALESEHADHNGLAYDAKLMVHDFSGGPSLDLPMDLSEYYEPGYAVRARVSSNSWGSTSSPKVNEGTDISTDRFLYMHSDFLGVFASGNVLAYGILSPAAAKNSLSVGAHENSRYESKMNNVARTSAWGPTYDGRIKPDILAPGSPVSSSMSDGSLTSNNCGLESKSGTSMATPFVAGTAVLYRQYFREGWYPFGRRGMGPLFTPSNSLLKAMIIHTAKAATGTNTDGTKAAVPNRKTGYGRMRSSDVLYFADETTRSHVWLLNNGTVKQDSKFSYCFEIKAVDLKASKAKHFRATMAWMDPPAVEGSKHSLINDIDMVVQGPDGKVVYPNDKTEFERNSNVEQVTITNPKPGNYRVFIDGYHVPEHWPYKHGLPYSLVVTGPSLIGHGEGSLVCSSNGCPDNCGGPSRGTCDKVRGFCKCKPQYHDVGCGLCNSETLCHGNGVCSNTDQTCKCKAHTMPKDCKTCEAGWFGPHCDDNCGEQARCSGHGICQKAEGRCACYNSEGFGRWAGRHCDKCDRNRRGATCTEKSHWCENHKVVSLSDPEGWIQINGGGYQNGMTCRWVITTPNPSSRITFRFTHITIEKNYDFVRIYSGPTDASKQVFHQEGHSGSKTVVVKGNRATVKFTSDAIGPDKGFELHYSVDTPCAGNPMACVGGGICEKDECLCPSMNDDPHTGCASEAPWHRPSGGRTHPPEFTPLPVTQPGATHAPPVPTAVPTLAPPVEDDCGEPIKCTGRGKCEEPQDKLQEPQDKLVLKMKICVCDKGYAGARCQLECPRDKEGWFSEEACNGHDCKSKTGRCSCKEGWFGDGCQWSKDMTAVKTEATPTLFFGNKTQTKHVHIRPSSFDFDGKVDVNVNLKICVTALNEAASNEFRIGVWASEELHPKKTWNSGTLTKDASYCFTLQGRISQSDKLVLGLQRKDATDSTNVRVSLTENKTVAPSNEKPGITVSKGSLEGGGPGRLVRETLPPRSTLPPTTEKKDHPKSATGFIGIGLAVGILLTSLVAFLIARRARKREADLKAFDARHEATEEAAEPQPEVSS